jgi:hypothetical protein
MSYYHRRSISGVTGNIINPTIKVGRPLGAVSIKTSLTPNKHKNKEDTSVGKVKPTLTRIEMDRTVLLKNLINGANTLKGKPINRPITSNSVNGAGFKSFRKDMKGNTSYDEENKIKVNRNANSKSPNTESRNSKNLSPDTDRTALLKGTYTAGFGKGNILKKDSLLKKLEDMKKDHINNKSINKGITVKEDNFNTSQRLQPRGTVTFSGQEVRDNKFNKPINPAFKDMNTSPLLIRVYLC